MSPNELANYQAVLNIAANLTEIIGLRYALAFVCAGILLAFGKPRLLAIKFIAIALVVGLVGLAAPGAINYVVAVMIESPAKNLIPVFTALCGFEALAVITIGLALFAYPIRVARSQGKPPSKWIFWLSIGSIIFAPLWSVSLFLAYRPTARAASESHPESHE
jgi:hypothetical protein